MVYFLVAENKEKRITLRMLLKTILNRVYHFKGFVYGRVTIDTAGTVNRIIVKIHHRLCSRGTCSVCGRRFLGYDHLPVRWFECIPLWNIPVLFEYAPRRIRCREHGVVVESLPWAEGEHHTTRAFEVCLAQWARLFSWQEVARRFRTSWDTVRNAICSVVDYGLEHRDLGGIPSIEIDELAVGKGQDYVTLVYQIDAGMRRLLWIGKDRTARTLLRFFILFGKDRAAAIKYVCSDMWKPYLKVIAKKIPAALNILDRFHIMKKFGEAIDDVRRKETAKLEQNGYEPVLTKSRWLLLKRPQNLSDGQKGYLRKHLEYNLQSVRAYLLRKEFQKFGAYTSALWARLFLHQWVRTITLSRIEPMKKVARMLRSHEHLIMNWFAVQGALSSGIVEVLNNTAKLTIKKSYGFRQYENLKYAFIA